MSNAGLGWEIVDVNADYVHPLPPLSDDEVELLLKVEGVLRSCELADEGEKRELEQKIREALLATCEEEGLLLDRDQLHYLSAYLFHHLFGLAFIDHLLQDDSIEEIAIPGIRKCAYVFVRGEGWKKVNARFLSELALMDVVNKVAAQVGRRLTFQHPRLNAVLPDGSRIHASLPPISPGELTIRKFRREHFSPVELVELGTFSLELLARLSLAMQADLTVLIAGNTASGKTTTLNALFSFVPLSERVVLVEETPEIKVFHPHQVRLVSNEDLGVRLLDLIYDTLRMRPDRMVVGEVRNKSEVEALFESVLSGQAKGTYATLHGKSARETLLRLRNLGVSDDELNALDVLLVQRRRSFYDRKAKKIKEVRVVEEAIWVKDGRDLVRSRDFVEMVANSLGLSMKEVKHELKFRERFLASAPRDFESCLFACQGEWYGLELDSFFPGREDE